MKDTRHYIICRFALDVGAGIDWTDADTFRRHLEIARQAIIPTLANQTDRTFTLLFLTHHDSEVNTALLKGLTDRFPIEVANPRQGDLLTPERLGGAERVITSRLDYDDYVDRQVVARIHNACRDDLKVLLYGLNTGATYDLADGALRLFANPAFITSGNGLHAPMCTVMYNTHYVRRPFTILDLGQHTECVASLLRQEGSLLRWSVRDTKFRLTDCHHTLGFLWTRHPLSFSVGSVRHNTDIDIRMSAAALQAKFGVPPDIAVQKI